MSVSVIAGAAPPAATAPLRVQVTMFEDLEQNHPGPEADTKVSVAGKTMVSVTVPALGAAPTLETVTVNATPACACATEEGPTIALVRSGWDTVAVSDTLLFPVSMSPPPETVHRTLRLALRNLTGGDPW